MIQNPIQNPQLIQDAAQLLADGKLLGLPTETVYGLAANAEQASAVDQIFTAKNRPKNHPLIVHIAHQNYEQQVEYFVRETPDFAQNLMKAFWPGALTLILPRRLNVASFVASHQESIALRCPAHAIAQDVLKAALDLGVRGVAAPSANRFGRVSPTSAAHVLSEFGNDLLILDGGDCQIGIESTIVDCTRGAPVLLRPGEISRVQIEAICHQTLLDAQTASLTKPAPKASGTLEAHYAPNAKVRLMSQEMLQSALDILGSDARHIGIYARSALKRLNRQIVFRQMPLDAKECAHELFSVLRSFDDQKVQLIWIETPPNEPDWEGVSDRLKRASAA